jgi:hypothetical protein
MNGPERAEGWVVASPENRPVGYEESRKGRGAGGIGEGGNVGYEESRESRGEGAGLRGIQTWGV